MDLINATNQMKFAAGEIHKQLYIISQKNGNHSVVGYVSWHPFEGAWFWFMGVDISNTFFQTKDLAIEALLHAFITFKMDKMSAKLGILDDENFTKKDI